jgi:hypothetical protein
LVVLGLSLMNPVLRAKKVTADIEEDLLNQGSNFIIAQYMR